MSQSATSPQPAPTTGPRRRPHALPSVSRMQWVYDRGFRMLCRGSALLVIGVMILLIVVLAYHSIPAIKKYGLAFLITDDWDPQGRLGAVAFVYGTLVTSFIGM